MRWRKRGENAGAFPVSQLQRSIEVKMNLRHPTIFLSSTFKDLKIHREHLLNLFRKFQLPCIAMEDFGARSKNSLKECTKAVKEADIFVIILGTMYGYCPDGDLSITEIEYDTAINNDLDVYYLIDESEHSVLPIHIDTDENREKLILFRQRLIQNHVYSKFNSPEDLVASVSTDMVRIVTAHEVDRRIGEMLEEQKRTLKTFEEGGYSFDLRSKRVTINKDFLGKTNSKARFSECIVGLYLATHISEGKFKVLKGFLTFEGSTWRSLILFLKEFGVDEKKLSQEIINTFDLDYLRLLIKLAGSLNLSNCIDAICVATSSVNGSGLMELVGKYRYIATPFFQVAAEALADMEKVDFNLLEKHLIQSKKAKHWQAYKAFKKAKDIIIRRESKKSFQRTS